jgi:aldose 1-epimerase
MNITSSVIGFMQNKKIIDYNLTNCNQLRLSIMNYGATITKIITKDKFNNDVDIVLGFVNFEGYLQDSNRYFGSTIGRFANRIGNSTFFVNDKKFILNANNGKNSLHGGKIGFDKVIWNAKTDSSENSVTFSYLSPHMEEGYPGNLNVSVKYKLTDENEIIINYFAETDLPTHVNLTNHSYFNLSSDPQSIINNSHEIMIKANYFLEVDDDLIPSGILNKVENTDLDFRNSKKINSELDFNWVLNKESCKLDLISTLKCQDSGISLDVSTTLPGLQVYSGNKIINCINYTKNPLGYSKFSGICLEAQFFPDSPNHLNFPSTLLIPSEAYDQTTIYKVSNNYR